MIRKKKVKLNTIFLVLVFLGLCGSQFQVIGVGAITEMATVDWYATFGYDDVDQGYSCAVDSNGNAYVAGDTKMVILR